jgi:dTDP-4-dehydrorhamnose 3,5-epimerase
MMRVVPHQSAIEGVQLFTNEAFHDDRGVFLEQISEGQVPNIVQVNTSHSRGGVLRGLHIQKGAPQGKAIFLAHGVVQDVFVDCRKGSPTFGEWDSAVLDASEMRTLWLPPGIAHGFLVLSEFATMIYGCTTAYNKASDGGIHWNDRKLGIRWMLSDQLPTVSVKDQALQGWDEFVAGMG